MWGYLLSTPRIDLINPHKPTIHCTSLYYGHLKLFLPREKLGPTNINKLYVSHSETPNRRCLLWLQPTQQCQLRGRLLKLVHLQGIKFDWFLLRKNRKLPTSPFFFLYVCMLFPMPPPLASFLALGLVASLEAVAALGVSPPQAARLSKIVSFFRVPFLLALSVE